METGGWFLGLDHGRGCDLEGAFLTGDLGDFLDLEVERGTDASHVFDVCALALIEIIESHQACPTPKSLARNGSEAEAESERNTEIEDHVKGRIYQICAYIGTHSYGNCRDLPGLVKCFTKGLRGFWRNLGFA